MSDPCFDGMACTCRDATAANVFTAHVIGYDSTCDEVVIKRDLRARLELFGQIHDVRISTAVRDKNRTSYVDFVTRESLELAVQQKDVDLAGRQLRITKYVKAG